MRATMRATMARFDIYAYYVKNTCGCRPSSQHSPIHSRKQIPPQHLPRASTLSVRDGQLHPGETLLYFFLYRGVGERTPDDDTMQRTYRVWVPRRYAPPQMMFCKCDATVSMSMPKSMAMLDTSDNSTKRCSRSTIWCQEQFDKVHVGDRFHTRSPLPFVLEPYLNVPRSYAQSLGHLLSHGNCRKLILAKRILQDRELGVRDLPTPALGHPSQMFKKLRVWGSRILTKLHARCNRISGDYRWDTLRT